MSTDALLDLDAARRERAKPEITVRFGGNDLIVPGELPVDVFDPFLAEDFDLVQIVTAVLDTGKDGESFTDTLSRLLETHPKFASQTLAALKQCFALLLGEGNYALFLAAKPSLDDYLALVKGLLKKYGVGLGEAFASLGSSEAAGATQSTTSTASTDSTPGSYGDAVLTSAPAS